MDGDTSTQGMVDGQGNFGIDWAMSDSPSAIDKALQGPIGSAGSLFGSIPIWVWIGLAAVIGLKLLRR